MKWVRFVSKPGRFPIFGTQLDVFWLCAMGLDTKMDKTVLDACCGSRKFWFDADNQGVIFMDRRVERTSVSDRSHGKQDGVRWIEISPDVVGDFRSMPFTSESFSLVVFDPPHLLRSRTGRKSWMATAYGTLGPDWRADLRLGFRECFRVLRVGGTLIFKWSETNVPLAEVLKLAGRKPLFGNRMPKLSGTHWVVFQKDE